MYLKKLTIYETFPEKEVIREFEFNNHVNIWHTQKINANSKEGEEGLLPSKKPNLTEFQMNRTTLKWEI